MHQEQQVQECAMQQCIVQSNHINTKHCNDDYRDYSADEDTQHDTLRSALLAAISEGDFEEFQRLVNEELLYTGPPPPPPSSSPSSLAAPFPYSPSETNRPPPCPCSEANQKAVVTLVRRMNAVLGDKKRVCGKKQRNDGNHHPANDENISDAAARLLKTDHEGCGGGGHNKEEDEEEENDDEYYDPFNNAEAAEHLMEAAEEARRKGEEGDDLKYGSPFVLHRIFDREERPPRLRKQIENRHRHSQFDHVAFVECILSAIERSEAIVSSCAVAASFFDSHGTCTSSSSSSPSPQQTPTCIISSDDSNSLPSALPFLSIDRSGILNVLCDECHNNPAGRSADGGVAGDPVLHTAIRALACSDDRKPVEEEDDEWQANSNNNDDDGQPIFSRRRRRHCSPAQSLEAAIIRLIHAEGVALDTLSMFGLTPFVRAASYGMNGVIKALLMYKTKAMKKEGGGAEGSGGGGGCCAKSVDVNRVVSMLMYAEPEETTALWSAMDNGHQDTVLLLLCGDEAYGKEDEYEWGTPHELDGGTTKGEAEEEGNDRGTANKERPSRSPASSTEPTSKKPPSSTLPSAQSKTISPITGIDFTVAPSSVGDGGGDVTSLLHMACVTEQPRVVRWLIEEGGVDPNTGLIPMGVVVAGTLAKATTTHRQQIDHDCYSSSPSTATTDEQQLNVKNTCHKRKKTPLYLAIDNGNPECFEAIMDAHKARRKGMNARREEELMMMSSLKDDLDNRADAASCRSIHLDALCTDTSETALFRSIDLVGARLSSKFASPSMVSMLPFLNIVRRLVDEGASVNAMRHDAPDDDNNGKKKKMGASSTVMHNETALHAVIRSVRAASALKAGGGKGGAEGEVLDECLQYLFKLLLDSGADMNAEMVVTVLDLGSKGNGRREKAPLEATHSKAACVGGRSGSAAAADNENDETTTTTTTRTTPLELAEKVLQNRPALLSYLQSECGGAM